MLIEARRKYDVWSVFACFPWFESWHFREEVWYRHYMNKIIVLSMFRTLKSSLFNRGRLSCAIAAVITVSMQLSSGLECVWLLNFILYCSSRTVRQTPMLSCLGSLTDGRSIHLWIALGLVSALFWYIAPKFFIFLTMVDNSYHRDYRKTKENVNYYVTIRK